MRISLLCGAILFGTAGPAGNTVSTAVLPPEGLANDIQLQVRVPAVIALIDAD